MYADLSSDLLDTRRDATVEWMPSGGSQSPQRRKLHVWADEAGLSRNERIDVAQYLLRRDITSWSQLDDGQVARLLDAFEGHHLIGEILSQRAASSSTTASRGS